MAHSRFRYYLNYSSKPWTIAQGLQKLFLGATMRWAPCGAVLSYLLGSWYQLAGGGVKGFNPRPTFLILFLGHGFTRIHTDKTPDSETVDYALHLHLLVLEVY